MSSKTPLSGGPEIPTRPGNDEIEERQMAVYHCDDCGDVFLTKTAMSGHYGRSDCEGAVGR